MSTTVVALVFAVWALWLWQPARQVKRHTERLLSAAENKNWSRLAELIADNYSDRWGHDKARVLGRSREVFAQFFVIGIEVHDLVAEESDGLGSAQGHLVLHGSGGPFAEMAVERVATLREPFTFTWRQHSWRPWDWQLERVEQPELSVEVE